MINSIARQPILDKNLRVFGYELLFRGEAMNTDGLFDHDGATSSVLYASLFSLGLEKLTQGKIAFVNFSDGLLTSGMIPRLPKKKIIIEILEHVDPDDELINICKALKIDGYQIALDDFVPDLRIFSLLPTADIVKVDVLNTSADICEEIPKRFAENGCVFLAEKVETYEQYRKAVDWGYTLFQGYFFCRPQRFDIGEIRGNKQVCFELLKAMQDEKTTMDQLEQIIRKDVFLSFAIIKFINSAAFGFRTKVQSLKNALTLLGLKKIREFSTILLLKRLGNDKPEELIVTSLIRGRFAEGLVMQTGMPDKSGEAFLVGIFSLVDALLDRPMQNILDELPLSEEVAASLQKRPGVLSTVLDTVVSYEKADWTRHDECLLGLPKMDGEIQQLYFEAVNWAGKIVNACDIE
jgi:EAL and modified HD-GYP domain-containing signal transduction protein